MIATSQSIKIALTHYLLLSVLITGQQVNRFHVPEVDVVAEEKDEQQLAHVLLLLVTIERLFTLELGANVRQLLVDTLQLRLFALACDSNSHEWTYCDSTTYNFVCPI